MKRTEPSLCHVLIAEVKQSQWLARTCTGYAFPSGVGKGKVCMCGDLRMSRAIGFLHHN